MRGLLVTLEGIDGSGKATQADLLKTRFDHAQKALAELGVPMEPACVMRFPQYQANYFGKLVRAYLKGELGDLNANHPLLVSLLYALDRWQAKDRLNDCLERYELVIIDRYVDSNVAHQGAKLPLDERETFVEKIVEIEYGILGLPEPNAVIFLDVPPEITIGHVEKERMLEGEKPDIHESVITYQHEVYDTYLSFLGGDNDYHVDCVDQTTKTLLPREAISQKVWAIVNPLLLVHLGERAKRSNG